MDCDDYQRAALRTARDKDAPDEFMHLVLGLVGETGEIAEKVKKLVRDQHSDLDRLDRDDMAAELGDVLWYAAVLADFLGLSLGDIARAQHRQARRPPAPLRPGRCRRQPLTWRTAPGQCRCATARARSSSTAAAASSAP